MTQRQLRDIIVIGASAGGVKAVQTLVSTLPADLHACVFLAIHMAPGYVSRLPEILSTRGPLRASHPVDGEVPAAGRIYVAPPDTHLQLRPGLMSVARGPKENGYRPSIDALFRSAASSYGPRVIGVVLTGYLDCGTAGLLSIKARGGIAIAQDPDEAEVASMPRSAIAKGGADYVVPLADMGALLARLTSEPAPPPWGDLPLPLLELEGERAGVSAPLVCPACQGVLTEAMVGDFENFRCHVGHAFSMRSVVMAQAESLERALWSAVRALDESANLMQRMADRSPSHLRDRFEVRRDEQRQNADTIRSVLLSQGPVSVQDAAELDPGGDSEQDDA